MGRKIHTAWTGPLLLNTTNVVQTKFPRGVGGGDIFDSAAFDADFASTLSLVDSVSGNNLIDFTRSSTATYIDSAGVIQDTKANLMPYSEDFASWTVAVNSTITSDNAVAPNGQMTADQLFFPATGSTNVSQSVTLEQNKTYTVSMWAKAVSAGVNDKFKFYINSTTPAKPPSDLIATAEWQRFEFTWTHTNATTSVGIFVLNDGDAYITDIYAFGFQLEEAASASDYIKTQASATFAPRFDHDFETLESLGLLIENSSTNKIRYSENFNIATTDWTTTNSGATSLSGVLSPDGVTYMTLMDLSAIAGSVSAGSRVYQSSSNFTSGDQAFSFYARSVSGTGTFPVGYYNGSAYIKDYIELTETIKRYTMIVPARVTTGNIVGWTRRGDTQLETLDQALVWGAQFEDVGYPTSYIRTSGTSATRSADLPTITGTNFSDWYNDSEGTFVTTTSSITNLQTANNRGIFAVTDTGTAASVFRHLAMYRGPTDNFYVISKAASATVFSPVTVGDPTYSNDSVGYGYSSSEASDVFYDGSQITTTTSTVNWAAYTANKLEIGSHAGSSFINGHVKRLTYWSTKLSDADMIEVTK